MKRYLPLLLRGMTLGCLLLLTACGKSEPAAPAAPPATTASVAPAAANPPTGSAPQASTAASAATASASAKPAGARSAPAAATSAIGPASATSASAPIAVAKVTLGKTLDAEHQVTDPSDSFATDDKDLYAVVATTGRSEGATLAARWSYLEGKGQLISNVSQAIATKGPATTSFKVHNPDLWPSGKYQVEISLDGKPVAKEEFAITSH